MRALALVVGIAGVGVIGFSLFMFTAFQSLSGLSATGAGAGAVLLPVVVALLGVGMLVAARAMWNANASSRR